MDALAEFAREGFEVSSWNIAKGAAEELLFQCAESSGEVGKFLAGRGGELLRHASPALEGARGDFGPGLAAPGDEGWFADAELAADAGEAQAMDAEAEEFVTGGSGVHLNEE